MVKRWLLGLALLFVAGAWEDILPGLDAWMTEVTAGTLPLSDADQDAGDGFVLSEAPAEAVLQCEVPPSQVRGEESCGLDSEDPSVREPLWIFLIPHVPISSQPA